MASHKRLQTVKGAITLLGVILVVQALYAQQKKPWNVNRVCGRVEYVKRIPDKKHPSNYSEKRKNLRGVLLELYESDENPACCMMKNVGVAISGKAGEFEFKPAKAGRYLLKASWNRKDYQVPINFEPQKKSSTVCSEQGIQIEDDGDANWWVTVTVD